MSQKDLVAYLDIIGFKEMVKAFVNGTNPNIIQKIEEAMDIAKKSVQNYTKFPITINLKQFSDCTSIHIPDISEEYDDPEERYLELIIYMLIVLRSFQNNLLDSNIYIRGGLSSGFHYESSNVIFSEGLIKSYKLEGKATYPRILLDESLVELIKDYYRTHKGIFDYFCIDEILITDSEGKVFLNPFNYYISLKNIKNIYKLVSPTKLSNHQLEIELKKWDYKITEDIINDIREQMIFFAKDSHKYEKYEWLNELYLWTNNSKVSRFKFDYCLK